MATEKKVTISDPQYNELDDDWFPEVTKPTSCHIDPEEEEYFRSKYLRVKEYLRRDLIPSSLNFFDQINEHKRIFSFPS